MQERRQPEIIAGRVNTDGSIAAITDERVKVTRSGPGVFVVYFPDNFRLVAATASANVATYVVASALHGTNLVQVNTWNSTTGGASDIGFAFIAVGVQT